MTSLVASSPAIHLPLALPVASHVQEQKYIDLVRNVYENGVLEDDRTGVGCHCLFGAQIDFKNVHDYFPLFTTKYTSFKIMTDELCWFLSGDTNAKTLQNKGVHIWDGNSSREYLDSRGLFYYEEGDCGPIYGFQWNHFGADYTNCHTKCQNGKGVNQIDWVLDQIKAAVQNKKINRQIVMSAWNPFNLPQMCLPPCHVLAQFYVSQGKYLNCSVYQRSCDLFLGFPYNVASYALLMSLFAAQSGLIADKLVFSLGSVHIYKNQAAAVEQLLKRSVNTENPSPRITLDDPSTWNMHNIRPEQIHLHDYCPQSKIFAPMAV